MNTLREVFYLEKTDVETAMAHTYHCGEIAHAFSYSGMGWNAYGIVPTLLRYLNNGNPAHFSGFPFKERQEEAELLLAFLLIWLNEDSL